MLQPTTPPPMISTLAARGTLVVAMAGRGRIIQFGSDANRRHRRGRAVTATALTATHHVLVWVWNGWPARSRSLLARRIGDPDDRPPTGPVARPCADRGGDAGAARGSRRRSDRRRHRGADPGRFCRRNGPRPVASR